MAHYFKTSDGHEREARVTIGTLRAVRDKYNLDISKLDAELFGRLADPVLFADVMREVCRIPETETAAFYDGFGGDTIDAALDALVQEIIAFFPDARARATMAAKWEEVKAASQRQRDAAIRSLETSPAQS